jgi:hypothetical protein
MSLMGSMFGFSVVLLLKITDVIINKYFYQYLFSQIAFFVGFLSFNKMPQPLVHYGNVPLKCNNRYFYIYIISSGIYIMANVITYLIVGIPIFAESSRLEYVAVGGGFGIITRIIGVFSPITVYLTFYFWFSSNKKITYKMYCFIIIILICLFSIFSGSKSAILGIINSLFMFLYLNSDNCGKLLLKMRKNQFKIFFFAAIGAIFVIIIQSGTNMMSSINALMFRLVSFGDTYYMAYPNGIIESLTSAHFLIVFLGDFFRTIRILPQNYIPPGMGFELSEIANKAPGILAGPNPRHNVYGYVNFDFFGSILFSLFCGFICNIVRCNFFSTSKDASQERKLFNLILYSTFLSLEGDPPSAIMRFNNIVFFFPIIIGINLILKYINHKTIQIKNNNHSLEDFK